MTDREADVILSIETGVEPGQIIGSNAVFTDPEGAEYTVADTRLNSREEANRYCRNTSGLIVDLNTPGTVEISQEQFDRAKTAKTSYLYIHRTL